MRIGENRFPGDLHTYAIDATLDDLKVAREPHGPSAVAAPDRIHALREPTTASSSRGSPRCRRARSSGTYKVDGETRQVGVGYHDHNWGNVWLLKVIHDWYWARGHAGPYSVIASYITAHEKYGYPDPIS